MSNIDKQALREAAEKATPGEWKRMMRNSDELMTTFHGIAIGNVFVELTTGKRDIFDAEFIAASNPATMLALLDELEAKDRKILKLEKLAEAESVGADKAATSCVEWMKRCHAAEKRIAELEGREVKPVKGEVLVTVSGFTGCGKSAIAGEIEIAMKAIGVPVTWSNGDAEKRMTGADWLTAIEMYKPTVRIIEVNVPRAAAAGKGE